MFLLLLLLLLLLLVVLWRWLLASWPWGISPPMMAEPVEETDISSWSEEELRRLPVVRDILGGVEV